MGWDTHIYKPVVLLTASLYLLRKSQVRQRKFPCNQNVSITAYIPFFRVVDAIGVSQGDTFTRLSVARLWKTSPEFANPLGKHLSSICRYVEEEIGSNDPP